MPAVRRKNSSRVILLLQLYRQLGDVLDKEKGGPLSHYLLLLTGTGAEIGGG